MPSSSAVAAAAAEVPDRVAFHAWVQWCFDRQLAGASEPLRRIADMPVGVDPGRLDVTGPHRPPVVTADDVAVDRLRDRQQVRLLPALQGRPGRRPGR